MGYFLKGKQCDTVSGGRGVTIVKSEVWYFNTYDEAKEGISIDCSCDECREAEEYNKREMLKKKKELILKKEKDYSK